MRTSYESNTTYSTHDDWSIPEFNDDGSSNRMLTMFVVLKDGNVLPTYWLDYDSGVPNPDSVEAIKQELMNGRGVSIIYYADQSGVYTMSSDDKGVSYNQYIDTPRKINHSVCIVGWDDDYPADSFSIAAPANGAWIVKNSWGSTADVAEDDLGNTINRTEYGVKNDQGEYTGYFYLSYYDKTISQPETMEFSSNLGTGGRFYMMQYDYMPAHNGFYTVSSEGSVMSSANVYTAGHDMQIKSVSARTSNLNTNVKFTIYLLNDDAKDPTDGTVVSNTSRNFKYGGFHRLDLYRPVTVKEGQTFSVVTTASVLNNDGKRVYVVSANKGVTPQTAEGYGAKAYSVAVVNEGESFIYSDGQWQDWKDYLETDNETEPVDNFSIKVYADAAERVETPVLPAAGTFYGSKSVSITCATKGATIYYTTDGSEPTTNSTEYTAPFSITETTTVKAVAVKTGMVDSDVVSATYTLSAGGDDGGGSSGGGGGGGGSSSGGGGSPAATVTPTAPETVDVSEKFNDVPEDAWYHDPVQWAFDKGLMNGVGDDVFDPDGTGTRAMVVTMLWRLAGEPEAAASDFGDVDDNSWYAQAVGWAESTGAVTGTGEDTFSPDVPVTREQLAVILYRYAQSKGLGFTGAWAFRLDYSDVGDISDYAYEAMCWMTMNGVITGMGDGTLAPGATANRAQIATMFQRFDAIIEA